MRGLVFFFFNRFSVSHQHLMIIDCSPWLCYTVDNIKYILYKPFIRMSSYGIRGGSRISSQGVGALKIIVPSGGRREHFWGISYEKSRFYAKKSYFFQFQGRRAPGVPPGSAPGYHIRCFLLKQLLSDFQSVLYFNII